MRAIARTLKRLGWIQTAPNVWMHSIKLGIRIRFTPRTMNWELRRQSKRRRAGVWETRLTLETREVVPRGMTDRFRKLTNMVLCTRVAPKQWNGEGRNRFHGPTVKKCAGGGKMRSQPTRRSVGW